MAPLSCCNAQLPGRSDSPHQMPTPCWRAPSPLCIASLAEPLLLPPPASPVHKGGGTSLSDANRGQGGRGRRETQKGSKQAQGSQMAKVPAQSSRIWDVCTNPISGSLQVFLHPHHQHSKTARQLKGQAAHSADPTGSERAKRSPHSSFPASPLLCVSGAPSVPTAALQNPVDSWGPVKQRLVKACPCPPF